MKKILPLLLIAFIICFAASYLVFSKIIPSGVLQGLQAATDPAASKQQVIAFIYVDEIEAQKPNLISVWVFFINDSDTLFLKFLPLLPAEDFNQTQEFAARFSLTDSHTVSPDFLAAINDKYQLSLHDYVVLDAEGMSLVSKWTLNKKSLIPTQAPESEAEAKKVLSATRKYLQSLCSYIPTIEDDSAPTDWEQLIPNHLRSNLLLEDFVQTLNLIRRQHASAECETIN
jgi:hypothetical protein